MDSNDPRNTGDVAVPCIKISQSISQFRADSTPIFQWWGSVEAPDRMPYCSSESTQTVLGSHASESTHVAGAGAGAFTPRSHQETAVCSEDY